MRARASPPTGIEPSALPRMIGVDGPFHCSAGTCSGEVSFGTDSFWAV